MFKLAFALKCGKLMAKISRRSEKQAHVLFTHMASENLIWVTASRTQHHSAVTDSAHWRVPPSYLAAARHHQKLSFNQAQHAVDCLEHAATLLDRVMFFLVDKFQDLPIFFLLWSSVTELSDKNAFARAAEKVCAGFVPWSFVRWEPSFQIDRQLNSLYLAPQRSLHSFGFFCVVYTSQCTKIITLVSRRHRNT